jgi:tetratricopeptide (TPR) repeat protein
MNAPGTSLGRNLTIEPWIRGLQEFVDTANFDGALEHLDRLGSDDLERKLALLESGTLADLRVRCILAEIYDYAGLSTKADKLIRPIGLRAQHNLKAVLEKSAGVINLPENDLPYLAQQCWTCLHLAMVEYRKQEYDTAEQVFCIAAKMLEKINHRLPSLSALSRAYYGLGLVERERHRYDTARQYFSLSLEHSWRRLEQNPTHAGAYAEYNIGRALGLGMAWLAFARASMWEANAHVVTAKLLLQGKAVKYIAAYIDIVHACTERSRAKTLPAVLEAIRAMEAALIELGGKDILHDPSKGHVIYAGRAFAELAMAHLSAARFCRAALDDIGKERHLAAAVEYVNCIKSTSLNSAATNSAQFSIRDRRTHCNALIIESRVFRELAQYGRALACAEEAYRVGSDEPFSRIDCWLALGEGHYWLAWSEDSYSNSHYNEAIGYFRKARDDKHAQTNPKVVAVCDLQIARCSLKMGQIHKAKELVRIWKTSGCAGKDNAFVSSLAEEVDKHIDKLEIPFTIPVNPDTLEADVWVTELRFWLATTAMNKANGDRTAAMRMVGLSSLKQFNRWLNRERA